MELDIGVGLTRVTENLTFLSTETESVLVLLAHLPGFKKDEIEISVDEAEREIGIGGGGGRSSLQAVISRRLSITREVEIGRFQKVFRIPDGVVLDCIDAEFDEEEAILLILMPKLIREEVSETGIEETRGGGEHEIPPDRDGEETLEPEKLDGVLHPSERTELPTQGDQEQRIPTAEAPERSTGSQEPEFPNINQEQLQIPETHYPHQEPEQQEQEAGDQETLPDWAQETTQSTESPEPDRNQHESEEQEEQVHEIPSTEKPDGAPGTPNLDQEQIHLPETPDPREGPEQQEEQQETPFVEIPDRIPETTESTELPEPDHNLQQSEEQEGTAAETADRALETLETTPEQESNLHETPAEEAPDQAPEATQSTEQQQEQQETPFVEIPDRIPETTESTELPEPDHNLQQSEEQEGTAAETADRAPETLEKTPEQESDLHETPDEEAPYQAPQTTQSTESPEPDKNLHQTGKQVDENPAAKKLDLAPETLKSMETTPEDEPELHESEEREVQNDRSRAKRRGGRRGSSPTLHPSVILAGSAFIFSLMALVLHLLRNRRRSSY